jgi:hypothetical protein
MILHVQYKDFKYDYVNTRVLDRLLADGSLIEFYRPPKKRMVNVYRDPIRGMGGNYSGPDRRQRHETKSV